MSPVSNVGEKVGYGYAYSRGRGYCGVARMNGRAACICNYAVALQRNWGNKGEAILQIDKS